MSDNNIENDVNEALNVTIPKMFAENESNYDLEFRYERLERLRQVCARKFEKHGISELFDSVDLTGVSILFPDNFNENKIIFTIMIIMLINALDDFTGSDIELDSNANEKQQNIKANKPSKWKITILLILYGLRWNKLSIYQICLCAKDYLLYLKEHISRHVLPRNLAIVSFSKYIKHRRIDVGGGALAIGLRNVFGISLNRNISNHKLIRSLDELYIDIMWQLNDLCSFKKECIRGEHSMNAITVLKNEHNVSWQTAVDMLAEITANTYQQLIDCIALVKESDLNIPNNYLDFLKEADKALKVLIAGE